MSTAQQIKANRRNAKKSRGPVTPAGKATVSQNAVRHGLAGQFRVLSFESQQEYDEFLNQFIADEKPVGLAETELVRKMAEHTWLARRALRLQDTMMMVHEQTPERKAAGEIEVSVQKQGLEMYMRYHTTHDRAYQRASKELRERQKQRRLAEIGFAREKRAEAEETRRAELHIHKVKAATLRSIAVGQKLHKALGPEIAAQWGGADGFACLEFPTSAQAATPAKPSLGGDKIAA